MTINDLIAHLISLGLSGDKVAFARQASKLARLYESSGMIDLAKDIRSSIQGKESFKLQKAYSTHTNTLERTDSLPVDHETKFDLADITQPCEDFVAPYFDNKVFDQIEEFILFNKKAETLKMAGLSTTSSMIFYGPPGCGKTLAAQHISNKMNLPLLTARCDSLVSSYLGSTSKNIRNLFDFANKQPCVLFLDELDALAKARDDQHELGELKRVVVSLLQNIDKMPDHTILIAASNHDSLLDSAIWRRFEYRLSIGLPDKNVRQKIFSSYIGIKKVYEGFTDDLAAISEGLSCAFITQNCLRAVRHALIYGDNTVDARFLIENIFDTLEPLSADPERKIAQIVNKLRGIDNKSFTIRKIAKILNLSNAKVSRLTKH